VKIYISNISKITPELLILEPVNVYKSLKDSYKQYNKSAAYKYFRCYSAIEELKNTYAILANFDLDITIDIDKSVSINSPYGGEAYMVDQNFFNNFITTHNEDNSVLILTTGELFFSEKSVNIHQYPAYFGDSPFSTEDFLLAPGTYDISKWLRPMNVGLINKHIGSKDKKITIKIRRGQPLYYLKFDTSEKIDFVYFKSSDEIHKFCFESVVSLKGVHPYLNLKKLYEMFKNRNYHKRILKEIKNNLF
jgi:hypothetical protein